MRIIYSALIFLLLSIHTNLYAQVFYPVEARITQTPPYPVYLADYSNPAQTNLSVQIRQNDASIASRSIRLKFFVEAQGLLIQSTDVVQGEPPLMLNYGQIYNLSTAEVANYFKQYNLKVNPAQYSREFPEGSLRFGVQVLDFQTSRALSGVQWGLPVWIIRNEPPVWVMPDNLTKITPSSIQNIVFQWAPRHSNVSDVEYEFILKELVYNTYSMGNVQNAFLSQPTFYSTRTTANTLVYNATMPPLIEGRIYGYRVRAIAKRGMEEVGVFNNNGYSEVQALYYGDPILPIKAPIITSLNRDELTNIATLDWKGEDTHTSFTVAYREKGSNGSWVGQTVLPMPNALIQSFTLNIPDLSKSYEIRVGAEDKHRQSAFSESAFLDGITAAQARDIQFSGKALWAFSTGEDQIKDNTSLTASTGTPGRTTNLIKSTGKAGSRKHSLSGVKILLVSSESENLETLQTANNSDYQIIKTATSDANGSFSFTSTNLDLLKDLQHFYLIADYGSGTFEKSVIKLGNIRNLKPEMQLGDIVLVAKSIRVKPVLIMDDPASFKAEDVGLYRLKRLSATNTHLLKEGNVQGSRAALEYNGQEYEKVGDFTSTSSVGGLFANTYFNDQFVLRIKETNRREVMIPLSSISDASTVSIPEIVESVRYNPIPFKLEGHVKRGNQPAANAVVQAFGNSVLTDASGYYMLEFPRSLMAGSTTEIKVIDPLNAASVTKENVIFNGLDATKNILINNNAFYLESRVVDTYQKPVSGAIVMIGGTMLKTDKSGWFSYAGLKLPTAIKVLVDGFDEAEIPLGSFTNNKITDVQTFRGLVKNPDISNPEQYFGQQFTQLGLVCSDYYGLNTIALTQTYKYRIIAFKEKTSTPLNIVNLNDAVEFTTATLLINDEQYIIPKGKAQLANGVLTGTGGLTGRTPANSLKISTVNGAGLPTVVEDEMVLSFPESATIKDTTTFLVQIKEGVVFNGVVLDSTMYIEGYHVPGTLRKHGQSLNPVAGAKVEISDAPSVITDNQGKFKVILPVGKDLVFGVSKAGFLKTVDFTSYHESNNYKSTARKFFVRQLDTNKIPEVKTLLGFQVEIDKILVNSSDVTMNQSAEEILEKGNRTYKIWGKIVLSPGGDNRYKVAKTTYLDFNDVAVRMQDKDSDNAVPVYNYADLNAASLNVLLFGYAPVKLKGKPLLRVVPMKGQKGHGVIVGESASFEKSTMAGLEFGTMKLEEAEEEETDFFDIYATEDQNSGTPKPGSYKAFFATLPLQALSEDVEFRILFGSKVSAKTLTEEGIDAESGPYYKAPFAATNVSGVYSAMNMYINHESATLNSDGVSLDGYFGFPKIWMFKNEGALTINSLVINQDFNLEELEIGKSPNAKKAEITKFSVANKWVLYVNTLKVTNNFKGFGFSGTFYADKKNYLNINSFSIAKIDNDYYPSLQLSTPATGLNFSSVRFTTLPDKTISFVRNTGEEGYEISAAFKMEFAPKGSVNPAISRIAKRVFPLTVDSFVWSTSGKFLIAVSLGNPIEVGPVKVSVDRLLFTKGGAITKKAINDYLKLTQQQIDDKIAKNAKNVTFASFTNTAGKQMSAAERKARNAISSDKLFVEKIADELAEEDPDASWAFGFAGGVQVINSKVKGFNFDSYFSFQVGDYGSGLDFELGDISLRLETTGFVAAGKVKIVTGDEKSGFEGNVNIETFKNKFAGAFKFYQLYDGNGKSTGIELGAAIQAKSNLVMGSLTWTSIGGGFDINTSSGKYKFFFLGSAINTGTSKDLVEYRDINVSVEFNVKECDYYPVIKGSMALFINKASYCTGSLEIDFCNIRVIGKFKCEKDFAGKIKVKIDAVLVASKHGFLAGCNVSTSIIGLKTNATFAIGVNFNTMAAFAAEVSDFVLKIPNNMKHDDLVTFSGIYISFKQDARFSHNGSVSVKGFDIVAYSLEISRNVNFYTGINFKTGSWIFRSVPTTKTLKLKTGLGTVKATVTEPNFYFKGRIEVLGFGVTGVATFSYKLEGMYNIFTGAVYFNASVEGEIQIYTDVAEDFKCNNVNFKWSKHTVMKYPCGIRCSAKWDFWNSCSVKWCNVDVSLPNLADGIGIKVCVGGKLAISYNGDNNKWSFSY